MNEYQKSALTVIKDVSVQLILIAVGVFALSGSLLTAQRGTPFASKSLLVWGFTLFILSVLAGLVALGNVVAQLSRSKFDAYAPILRSAYFLQLALLLGGGILFVLFLLTNIP